MKLAGVSLFLPMYNEEANVERAVGVAIEVLEELDTEFEVIVIDDGSRDATAAIVRRLMQKDARLRLIEHGVNRGYGAAVRSGITAARLPLTFFTDGDNQFDLRQLARLVGRIEGADIVSGYRRERRDPWHRRLYGFLYNRLARLLFDVPVRDVNCAFKLMRTELVQGLELKSSGALINVELLARARKRGAVVREVAVDHYPRTFGSQTGARPAVILRAFRELLRLWRELR